MRLIEGFQLVATSTDGVARLRELILSLAVQGKLVSQESSDERAQSLLYRIGNDKRRLIAEGAIAKDKPLPEIGDDETPFQLPNAWGWVRLGSVSKRIQYGFTASARHDIASPKFVRITDIQGGRVAWDTVPGVVADEQTVASHGLEDGDILIARTGGTIGKSFLVNDVQIDAIFASYLIRISPLGIDPRYIKVFLSSGIYWDQLYAKAMGTGQPNVNGTALSQLVLPCPPLAEQARIVAKVDELMRLCDELEARGRLEAEQHARLSATLFHSLAASESPHALAENWARAAAHFDLLLDRPEAVDALEQVILQLAVRGLLVPQDPADEPASELLQQIEQKRNFLIAEGKIKRKKPLPSVSTDDVPFTLPAGWTWARFGNIAEISSNLVVPTKYSAMRQVAPDCIEKRTGRLLQARSVKESGVTSPNHRFRSGQILYSKIRPSLSKAVVADFDGLCSADMYPIDSYADTNYLHRYILSEPFLEQVKDAENRVKMPKLNQEALNLFLIAVPPQAEQLRIVKRIEEMRHLCADLRQRLTTRQTCQAHFAEALAEQAAIAPLVARTDALAAAA
jgi:type I restriction enzyme S subunit